MICVFDLILQVIKWCVLRWGGREGSWGEEFFLFLQTTNPVWGAITNYYVSSLVYVQKLKPELTIFFNSFKDGQMFSDVTITIQYGKSYMLFTFFFLHSTPYIPFKSTESFGSSFICDFLNLKRI